MADPICLAYGSLIAVVVSLLNGIPFVAAHKKTTALMLSVAMTVIPFVAPHIDATSFQHILSCVLSQWTAAVTTTEVAKSTKTLLTNKMSSKSLTPPDDHSTF